MLWRVTELRTVDELRDNHFGDLLLSNRARRGTGHYWWGYTPGCPAVIKRGAPERPTGRRNAPRYTRSVCCTSGRLPGAGGGGVPGADEGRGKVFAAVIFEGADTFPAASTAATVKA